MNSVRPLSARITKIYTGFAHNEQGVKKYTQRESPILNLNLARALFLRPNNVEGLATRGEVDAALDELEEMIKAGGGTDEVIIQENFSLNLETFPLSNIPLGLVDDTVYFGIQGESTSIWNINTINTKCNRINVIIGTATNITITVIELEYPNFSSGICKHSASHAVVAGLNRIDVPEFDMKKDTAYAVFINTTAAGLQALGFGKNINKNIYGNVPVMVSIANGKEIKTRGQIYPITSSQGFVNYAALTQQ